MISRESIIPVQVTDPTSDFIQTPLPDVSAHEEIDVVVMDFAMDDFRQCPLVLFVTIDS